MNKTAISNTVSSDPRIEYQKSYVRVFFAGLMVAIGIAHLVGPSFFISIMPPYLPWPGELVLVSGIAEMAGGIGLIFAKIRSSAGWGLVVLLVCVFPANVNMTLHPGSYPGVLLWLRLLLQPALIWIAWWVGPARFAHYKRNT